MKSTANHHLFVFRLLKWNNINNNRLMPWKGEKDPYKIWLSEIILQQTRVQQGLEYYNRFVAQFPTIHHLAKSSETKVFKLWEGLGYYTRCKNLIATATYISKELKGRFPDRYKDILSLKGIGPYTAAAIGSFAFKLPYAVVDGNVFRVLSRYFGITTAIDTNEGKKLFTTLANELLDKDEPGIYNQSLMDFGAVICKPVLPLCTVCPLKSSCSAYIKGMVNELPVKEKSITKKRRWLYYFVIEHKGQVYVRKRGAGDIWENLYEFMLIEKETKYPVEELKKIKTVKEKFGKNKFEIIYISRVYKQLLTHQIIEGRFIGISIHNPVKLDGYELLSEKEIKLLPFPKFITAYLKDKNVPLKLFQGKAG